MSLFGHLHCQSRSRANGPPGPILHDRIRSVLGFSGRNAASRYLRSISTRIKRESRYGHTNHCADDGTVSFPVPDKTPEAYHFFFWFSSEYDMLQVGGSSPRYQDRTAPAYSTGVSGTLARNMTTLIRRNPSCGLDN